MKDYRHLDVWMKAHKVALAVYEASRGLPKDEIYGLTSQMRRVAVSICANIAEGCGRKSDSELARFLQIARGSASELDYHFCWHATSNTCLRWNTENSNPEFER